MACPDDTVIWTVGVVIGLIFGAIIGAAAVHGATHNYGLVVEIAKAL